MLKSLRCSLVELIEAAFRLALLRNGCTSCEIEGLVINDTLPHGGSISLASVRAPDGRELFRVHDLDDLDRLLADPNLCKSLAVTIQRLVRKNKPQGQAAL